MDRSFAFWRRWLIIAACCVLLLGLSLVVLPGPTQRLFNLMFFSSPQGNVEFSRSAALYIAFIYAVAGAVMFGWAVLLLYVLYGTFSRRRREGWDMIAASLLAWFVPDTAFSLWSGFSRNVILNVGFLILFAVPLAATYRVFHPKR